MKEAQIESYLALSYAFIADKKNLSIGRKTPVEYLKNRYSWTSETIAEERMQPHLISIPELANVG